MMLEIEQNGRKTMAKSLKTSGRKKAENNIEGVELAPLLEDFLENGQLVSYFEHIGLGLDGFRNGTSADHPAHRRITTQALGVVYILVAAEAAEDGLPEQALHRMLSVLARARINEFIADHDSQTEGIIEFAIGQ